jgi:hypothetical protein
MMSGEPVDDGVTVTIDDKRDFVWCVGGKRHEHPALRDDLDGLVFAVRKQSQEAPAETACGICITRALEKQDDRYYPSGRGWPCRKVGPVDMRLVEPS